MSKNSMKRFVCGVLALTSMTACVVTSTACETKNPTVKMTIAFNGEEYVLDYKLYRELAPTTVKHFLYLAENNYYDGLCVHNYEEAGAKMYTGAYTYNDEKEDNESGLTYKNYYEVVAQYVQNGHAFPASVWMDKEKEQPTYTLYGEFEENNFEVESGSLRQTFGSLTMYYSTKNSDDGVYTQYVSNPEKLATREYKYNSATSQFYISLSNSSTRNDDYCTFAELEEKSEETLKAFQEALEEYIEENYEDEDGDSTFTKKYTMTIDEDDKFVGTKKNTTTFYVPEKQIKIVSVVVTKQ